MGVSIGKKRIFDLMVELDRIRRGTPKSLCTSSCWTNATTSLRSIEPSGRAKASTAVRTCSRTSQYCRAS
jgi:hypothetical protein